MATIPNPLQIHGGAKGIEVASVRPNMSLASGNIQVEESGSGAFRTIRITCKDVPITLKQHASGDYGSVKIADFLRGEHILLHGGAGRLLVTASSGIAASQSTEAGLGSAAIASGATTLDGGTQENFIDAVATNSSANQVNGYIKSDSTAASLDMSGGAASIYFNIASTTGLVSADVSAVVNGWVQFHIMGCGNYLTD